MKDFLDVLPVDGTYHRAVIRTSSWASSLHLDGEIMMIGTDDFDLDLEFGEEFAQVLMDNADTPLKIDITIRRSEGNVYHVGGLEVSHLYPKKNSAKLFDLKTSQE